MGYTIFEQEWNALVMWLCERGVRITRFEISRDDAPQDFLRGNFHSCGFSIAVNPTDFVPSGSYRFEASKYKP